MVEIIEPAGILKRYIRHYCIVEIKNSRDYLPAERVFPGGNICIAFHYGYPSKFKKKNSEEYIEPVFVICGQQTGYYDLSLSGNTGMILIIFKPHGFRAFFNLPASELLDENIPFSDLIKNETGVLEDKLLNSRNNKQRIAYLESYLSERLVFNRDFDRIDYAIRLIECHKGRIKTGQLSEEVCLGIKQFERIFSRYVGLSPKKFSDIVRFQHVMQMKSRIKISYMYQLAFDNGYYDQSHFIHDFKSLTGLTPREFFNNK